MLGGLVSDFVGAYGQPSVCNRDALTWVHEGYTIEVLNADPVTDIFITHDGWDAMTKQRVCESYFPTNPTFLSEDAAGYHFSATATGEFTMTEDTHGCTIEIGAGTS